MDGLGRKLARKPLGPRIRCQMHGPSTRFQLMCQRFCRKHMSAGAACTKKGNLVRGHSAGTSKGDERLGSTKIRACGLRRVSASTNPIETAMATSDEPP